MYFLQPSQKRLLNSLNPVFVVLFLFALLVFRSTTKAMTAGTNYPWDVLLPFAVYFGQRRTLVEGLILTLFTAHLYSLCSAAPIGVFTIHYLILFLIARAMSYVVYASGGLSILALMFLLAVLSRFGLPLVASFFGHGWPIFSFRNFIWWGPFFNALAGWLTYVALVMIDRMTYKAPRINIELSEGGL